MIGRRDPRPWFVMLGLGAVPAAAALADVRRPHALWGLVGVLAFTPSVHVVLVVLAALLLAGAWVLFNAGVRL